MEEFNAETAVVAGIVGTAILVIPWLISKFKSKSESNIALPSRNDVGSKPSRNDVGSKYNEWREPIFEIGVGDTNVVEYFRENDLNFSRSDWQKSCQIMDKVVKVIAREMRAAAATQFPGLILDETLIKQGSSREGLKVCDALEFDFILPFRLEGVRMVERESVFNCKGNSVSGLFKQRVISHDNLPSWMMNNALLEESIGGTYINTRNFQSKVFTSLLDQSEYAINQQLKRLTALSQDRCQITRTVSPPTLKIRIENNIELKRLSQYVVRLESANARSSSYWYVEADLVPAMCLSPDTIPDPYTVDDQSHKAKSAISSYKQMSCERYGVMKWVSKRNPDIPESEREFLWRNSTCGYEKHIFDVARRNPSQRYVMTACRLLKGALHEFQPNSTDQLGSVVKSYHLKNICFYCILFLTIPSKENTLSGVMEALGYFVKYLELSIEKQYLPHFFHGNPYIHIMFPGSPFEKEIERYNLFSSKDPETLLQARYSLPRFLRSLKGLYKEGWMLDPDKINLYRDLL